MKYQFHLLMTLLLLSIVPTFISCDKDEPIGPGKEVVDTTFSFNCKVKGVDWNGTGKAAASAQIKQIFPQIDSLPQAFYTGDTLLLGVGGLYNDYQATMLIAILNPNKSNLVGTYNFATSLGTLSAGKAIGVFDGSATDFLTYATGLSTMQFVDSSRIIITEHKNNRISGTFQFVLEHVITEQTFNRVESGTFKNFKIKQ